MWKHMEGLMNMSDVQEKKGFLKSVPLDVKLLMLVLFGFMLLIFDQHVVCSFLNGIYPKFVQSYDINAEFQLFTINSIFGMSYQAYDYSDGEMVIEGLAYNLKVDIFPDLLGYILIAIGLYKLAKRTKIFNLAATTSVGAVVLYVITRLLPFVFTGEQLSYICFWLIIAQTGIEICIGYMFVFGICDLIPGYQYVRDRRAIGISWFASVILNIVVVVINWMAPMLNPALLVFYHMFDLAANLLYFYFIIRIRDYILGYKKA